MSARGRFLWFDLITPDKDASIAFYTDVVGWTITPWGPDGGYAMWTAADGRPIGGVEQADDGHQWLAYMGVEDVDVGAELVEAMTGRIVKPPFDIEGVGRAVLVADPGGAVAALLTPDEDPGEATPPAGPGHLAWFDLATTEPKRTTKFWMHLMDWTDVDTMRSPMGKYLMLGPDRSQPALGGLYQAPEGAASGWIYYFGVPDLDAALARVTAGGGTVRMGPMRVPSGDHVAHCIDPHGVAFALHQKG